MNVEDEDSVIEHFDTTSYVELMKNNIISGGMIPKVDNAFAAIKHNVSEVVIGHADDLHNLISGKAGTKIK